jgi:hypothetical protein
LEHFPDGVQAVKLYVVPVKLRKKDKEKDKKEQNRQIRVVLLLAAS